jgi:hypothetical protein
VGQLEVLNTDLLPLSAGQAFEKFMEPQGFLRGTGGVLRMARNSAQRKKWGVSQLKRWYVTGIYLTKHMIIT